MFKAASVYALKRLSDQERSIYGVRVLVMRSWPRGITKSDVDLWIPSAAPPAELLAAHRAGRISWHDFTIVYRASQVMATHCRVLTYRGQERPVVQEHARRALDYLHDLACEQGIVTVLCWEPEGEPCHRHLLKDLLEIPAIEADMKASLYCGSELPRP